MAPRHSKQMGRSMEPAICLIDMVSVYSQQAFCALQISSTVLNNEKYHVQRCAMLKSELWKILQYNLFLAAPFRHRHKMKQIKHNVFSSVVSHQNNSLYLYLFEQRFLHGGSGYL